MKKLQDIIDGLTFSDHEGEMDKRIREIQFDSRKVKKGDMFVAIPGTHVDGHKFIDIAVEQGASVVVGEYIPKQLQKKVTYIEVTSSASALGIMASNYYEHPSSQLKLVGVTGTNGKTSVVSLLYNLFSQLSYKTGLLSTVENRIGPQVLPSTHTTSDVLTINRLLAQMVEAGCEFAFMEVSSHAIHQKRIAGLNFDGGIFTNISHDHLDYHGTFKDYIFAKKAFFDELGAHAFALINLDDKRGEVMWQNTKAKKVSYGLLHPADFKAKVLENRLEGLWMDVDGKEVHCRLIGEFNAYNLLSVYACAVLLEEDPEEVLPLLSALKSPEGRFDYMRHPESGKVGIVDYAHTPDALEKVIDTVNQLKEPASKLYTVVGCGGDRDKTKRPEMARLAALKSDQLVLTSDNPRSEDPESILDDMEKGVPDHARSRCLRISDRAQAIKTACTLARKMDIILVAGKGHEKYQEIKGKKLPFDDKAYLLQYLEQ